MDIDFSLIKTKRKAMKMTGEELGKKVGVSKQTISKYENGTVSIKNKTLKAICDVLDIDMNEIYGRQNDEYLPNVIAAHHDDDDWTEEELSEIEDFKQFVKSKRK